MTFGPEPSTDPATPSAKMPAIKLGVDVSHHQNPTAINWEKLAETHSFVIARACYGATPDRQTTEHARRAREVGLTIGLYMFLRPTQSIELQLGAFSKQAKACGLRAGDLPPALDIEDDPGNPPVQVTPYLAGPVRRILSSWECSYGCRPLVYCTARDWRRLGAPRWLLEYPLWVAHWGAVKPTTPGDVAPKIWQHAVLPLAGVYAAKIDQNIAYGDLPRIPLLTAQQRRRVEGITALTIDEAKRRK